MGWCKRARNRLSSLGALVDGLRQQGPAIGRDTGAVTAGVHPAASRLASSIVIRCACMGCDSYRTCRVDYKDVIAGSRPMLVAFVRFPRSGTGLKHRRGAGSRAHGRQEGS